MAGQDVLTPVPNISFQIVFVPQENQRGQTPELISQAKIIGQDQWTGEILQSTAPSIDTTLPDDQTVDYEAGVVQ